MFEREVAEAGTPRVPRARQQSTIGLGTIAAVSFMLLSFCVVSGASEPVDRRTALALNGALREDEVVLAMRAVTALGSATVLLPFSLAVTAFLVARSRGPEAVLFVVTTMSGRLAVWGFKELIDRPRPHFAEPLAMAYGWSFPSGHAAESLMVVGMSILVLRRPLMPSAHRAVLITAAALIGAIGFTRLALGVHYLTDVVAGWALGLLWLSAAALLLAKRPIGPND